MKQNLPIIFMLFLLTLTSSTNATERSNEQSAARFKAFFDQHSNEFIEFVTQKSNEECNKSPSKLNTEGLIVFLASRQILNKLKKEKTITAFSTETTQALSSEYGKILQDIKEAHDVICDHLKTEFLQCYKPESTHTWNDVAYSEKQRKHLLTDIEAQRNAENCGQNYLIGLLILKFLEEKIATECDKHVTVQQKYVEETRPGQN